MRIGALAAALLLPGTALACGGLFCDNAQPVQQSAERIVFARDGDTVHMHVRITYQGPPAEFGWLLPVPPDVQTEPSSEAIFQLLDGRYAPSFQTRTVFDDGCGFGGQGGAGGSGGSLGGAGGGGGGGGVQVLSREPVGPYDQAVLQAHDVGTLRQWLTDNGYQIPDGADERLAPYVDMGAAFVALKLLPDADSGDVTPLHLWFSARQAAIPLRPTAVAAQPDMGVIVQVYGDARAVPVNYRHVEIDEAAIDWPTGGSNYADVVSQAVDEAGGQAFTTDFAGRVGQGGLPPELEPGVSRAVRAARTIGDLVETGIFDRGDPDVTRVVRRVVTLPDGIDRDAFFDCPRCNQALFGLPVDGDALADALHTEVDSARASLSGLASRHPYLTRLYTTISPEEMGADPAFAENPDLPDVANVRVATAYVSCSGDFGSALLVTPSGLRLHLAGGAMPDAIERDRGRTVRGQGLIGASVIEWLRDAGQPEVEQDRRAELQARYDARQDGSAGADAGASGAGGSSDGAGGSSDGAGGSGGSDQAVGGGSGGCDCDVSAGAPVAAPWLLLVALARRRRSVRQ